MSHLAHESVHFNDSETGYVPVLFLITELTCKPGGKPKPGSKPSPDQSPGSLPRPKGKN